MGKEEILKALNKKKEQLKNAKSRLNTLNEQYDTLEDLSSRCQSRMNSFSESMEKRNNRLLRLDSFLGNVKSAKRFKDKMLEMLKGNEYSNTTRSIDNLTTSISNKKKTVVRNINDTEDEVTRLEAEIEKLQYEYATCPEEVCANGKS